MDGGRERSAILKKGGKGREKNWKECSDRDGWRLRKKCNIEERREREKKMGKNAVTEAEGG